MSNTTWTDFSCPNCKSRLADLSPDKTYIIASNLAVHQKTKVRCRDCNHYFYFIPRKSGDRMPNRRSKNLPE